MDIVSAVQKGKDSVVFIAKNGSEVQRVTGELIQCTGDTAIVRKTPGSDACQIYEIQGSRAVPTGMTHVPRR